MEVVIAAIALEALPSQSEQHLATKVAEGRRLVRVNLKYVRSHNVGPLFRRSRKKNNFHCTTIDDLLYTLQFVKAVGSVDEERDA